MDEDIGKVLLAQAGRLRSTAFSQHRFVEGELALRVVRKSAGGIGRLLVQPGVALLVQAELVPANAAAVRGRSDGMLRQDELMIAEVAVHEPLDQLVALRIEAAFRARLRDAGAQLAVAEIMIGR
jgi:hypothetical protein